MGASTYDGSLGDLVWIPECMSPLADIKSSRKLPALYLPSISEETKHYIIYFHGNSCDLGDMKTELLIIRDFADVAILAVEYPGYGCCVGKTEPSSPESVNCWALAAYVWLLKKGVSPRSIVIFGRSIGTGPAAFLAAYSRREMGFDVGSLVLHSPYESIHAVLDDYASVGRYLLPNFWDVGEMLSQLAPAIPLLLIHGENDEVIPVRHGKTLFNSYNVAENMKQGSFPADSEHNSYLVVEDIGVPLKEFLNNKSRSRLESKKRIPLSMLDTTVPLEYIPTLDPSIETSVKNNIPQTPDSPSNGNPAIFRDCPSSTPRSSTCRTNTAMESSHHNTPSHSSHNLMRGLSMPLDTASTSTRRFVTNTSTPQLEDENNQTASGASVAPPTENRFWCC